MFVYCITDAKTMKEYFILQLLHKQFTGQLEEVDKGLLSDWVSQSADNEAFRDSIMRIWQASANYAPPVSFEARTDAALDRFRNNIRQEVTPSITQEIVETKEKTAKVRSLNSLKWISGIAASAIVLFSAFFLLKQNNGSNYESLATLSNQTQELQLTDQSTVWVNEKSTIKYFTESPKDERKVFLNGVAFFDITKDNEKPFIIETENAFITVLGTKFNVNADEHTTTVMVKEGKVELRPKLSNQKVILMENMTGVFEVETKKLYRKQSKSYNGDSWITGGYAFEDDMLSEVFSVLENHYNVDIYVKNTEINTCVFTSPVYQDTELESVLDIMQLIYGFTYELKDERYIIEGGSCSKK